MPVQMLPTHEPQWPAHLNAAAPLRPPLRPQSAGDEVARVKKEMAAEAKRAIHRVTVATGRQLERVKPWNRRCWICKAPAFCEHREPELMEMWKGSK